MNKSIIRGLFIFAAGAGCATVVAQYAGRAPPPITPYEFDERASKLIVQVAELGQYVDYAKDGQVHIFQDVGACISPPPPPPIFVDPRLLRRGVQALTVLAEGKTLGVPEPIKAVDKCQTAK